MKTKIYNKLVRDNIPQIIADDGYSPHFKTLASARYIKELGKKLIEESKEFSKAKWQEQKLREIADVYEVLNAIIESEKISELDIAKKRKEIANAKGTFKKRIFLVKTVKNS